MQKFITLKIHNDSILPEVWETRTPNELVQVVRYRSIATGYQSLWEFAQNQRINPNSFRLALLDLYNPPSSQLKAKIIRILADKLNISKTDAIPSDEKLKIDIDTWVLMPGIQRTALIRLLALHHGFRNLKDLAKHLEFDNFERFRMFVSRGVNKAVLDKLSHTLHFTFTEKNKLLESYSHFLIVTP